MPNAESRSCYPASDMPRKPVIDAMSILKKIALIDRSLVIFTPLRQRRLPPV